MQDEKYRHEYKYHINPSQYFSISQRLKTVMGQMKMGDRLGNFEDGENTPDTNEASSNSSEEPSNDMSEITRKKEKI